MPVEIEYHWHNVYVIKRPGVDNFLKKMGEIYEVVVFTASLSKVCFNVTIILVSMPDWRCQYADPVLDKLDIHRVVSHRLFRESCYNHRGNYVKVRYWSLIARLCVYIDIMPVGPLAIGTSNRRHHHHRQLASIVHLPPQ